MVFEAKVRQIGSFRGIVFTQKTARALNLNPGDTLILDAVNGEIKITKSHLKTAVFQSISHRYKRALGNLAD